MPDNTKSKGLRYRKVAAEPEGKASSAKKDYKVPKNTIMAKKMGWATAVKLNITSDDDEPVYETRVPDDLEPGETFKCWFPDVGARVVPVPKGLHASRIVTVDGPTTLDLPKELLRMRQKQRPVRAEIEYDEDLDTYYERGKRYLVKPPPGFFPGEYFDAVVPGFGLREFQVPDGWRIGQKIKYEGQPRELPRGDIDRWRRQEETLRDIVCNPDNVYECCCPIVVFMGFIALFAGYYYLVACAEGADWTGCEEGTYLVDNWLQSLSSPVPLEE